MRIGIIGAGHIGGTLAGLFTRVGHEVALANSRGPDTLAGLVAQLGGRAHAATPAEAAAFGDVVVVSIPFGRVAELPAGPFAGRIVVDTTNYYARRDGPFPGDGASSSEVVARHLAGARVVKAFNAIHWERLRDLGRPAGHAKRLAIPVASDDEEAKLVVAELIDQIGFDPVDFGNLAVGGRRQEPGSPAFNRPMTADTLRRTDSGG